MSDWECLTPEDEGIYTPLDYRLIDDTFTPHEIRRSHGFTFLSVGELDALAIRSNAWAKREVEIQTMAKALQDSQYLLILLQKYLDASGDPLDSECATIRTIKMNESILAPFEEI